MGQAYIFLVLLVLTGNVFLLLKNRKAKLQLKDLIGRHLNEKELLIARYESEIAVYKERTEKMESLARVVMQTENAVMLMDAKGDIIWVNKAFEKLYEYSYDSFTTALGNNIRQTSFNPAIHERLRYCFSTKQSVTYEALNTTRTGREIWTHTSLIPLLNDNDDVVGLVTIDSDVHKRIKTGEEMSQFIVSFNQQIEKMAEQVNIMVELANALFERIEISQRRMNRTDQIIGFIKEISDQIKILGINASIEAHTAGMHGLGFRVISGEIVSISNVILNSLNEINELIGGVKRTSEKLGAEKERSVQSIENHQNIITDLKHKINAFECALKQIS